MNNEKIVSWILRVGVAGEFLGHGVFALQGKSDWVKWIGQLLNTSPEASATLLMIIGVADLLTALIVLVKPMKPVLLWAAAWGLWTAFLRPMVGLPIWDFIERFANWAAPLALYYIMKKENKIN